jgi:hypothetical protein
MNSNSITHADFVEHPEDVRTESGALPSLILREGRS